MAESEEKNQQSNTPELAPESDPKKPLPTDFEVLLVNIDKVMLEGKAKSMMVPVPYGNLAVLPGHTPLFTKLVKGTVSINLVSGESKSFEIENGIAKMTQFKVTVLVGF